MKSLDDKDRAIVRLLMADGSLTSAELARRTQMSQPMVWRRIKALEEAQIFSGRELMLDHKALGFDVTVFLGIKLATRGRLALEEFERALVAIPEVQQVQHVLGLYDYRVRVVARDLADFERILRRRIMTIQGVGTIESNVLLREETRPLIV